MCLGKYLSSPNTAYVVDWSFGQTVTTCFYSLYLTSDILLSKLAADLPINPGNNQNSLI